MRSRVIAGVIIIIAGLGFLFDKLFGYSFGLLIADWWALIIVGFGIKLISDSSKNMVNGIAITLAGLIILMIRHDLVTGNIVGTLWPLLLILAGIYFIASRNKGREKNVTAGNDFKITSVFSGNHQIIDAGDFKNGSVTTIFGGAEIDLRNADIAEEAFIDITCLFGGVEIKIPEGWSVKSHGTPILGGFENKASAFREKAVNMPVLNVNYLVMFGGIDIKD